jgi:hypothetical protein
MATFNQQIKWAEKTLFGKGNKYYPKKLRKLLADFVTILEETFPHIGPNRASLRISIALDKIKAKRLGILQRRSELKRIKKSLKK